MFVRYLRKLKQHLHSLILIHALMACDGEEVPVTCVICFFVFNLQVSLFFAVNHEEDNVQTIQSSKRTEIGNLHAVLAPRGMSQRTRFDTNGKQSPQRCTRLFLSKVILLVQLLKNAGRVCVSSQNVRLFTY